MNYEGMLYALSRYDVRGLLVEPFGVDAYLQRSAIRGGPNAKLELGDYWQLLMLTLPELSDGIVIDGTPAAHCKIWPADQVSDDVQRLAALDAPLFSQRVQAQLLQPAAATKFPTDQDKLECLRSLLRLKVELNSFLQAAAQRRDASILYVV